MAEAVSIFDITFRLDQPHDYLLSLYLPQEALPPPLVLLMAGGGVRTLSNDWTTEPGQEMIGTLDPGEYRLALTNISRVHETYDVSSGMWSISGFDLSFSPTESPTVVPDGGSSWLLFSIGLVGLAIANRAVSRQPEPSPRL